MSRGESVSSLDQFNYLIAHGYYTLYELRGHPVYVEKLREAEVEGNDNLLRKYEWYLKLSARWKELEKLLQGKPRGKSGKRADVIFQELSAKMDTGTLVEKVELVRRMVNELEEELKDQEEVPKKHA